MLGAQQIAEVLLKKPDDNAIIDAVESTFFNNLLDLLYIIHLSHCYINHNYSIINAMH